MATSDGDDPFDRYFRDSAPRPGSPQPARYDAPRPGSPRPGSQRPGTPRSYQPPRVYEGSAQDEAVWEPPERTGTNRRVPVSPGPGSPDRNHRSGPPRNRRPDPDADKARSGGPAYPGTANRQGSPGTRQSPGHGGGSGRTALPPELDPRGPGGRRGVPTRAYSPWRRLVAAVGALLSVVILATSGIMYYVAVVSDKSTIEHGLGANQFGASSDDGAQNYLIMGSDSRQGLTQAQEDELHTGSDQCNCTDTMMLVHISPDRSKAIIVSFPRDTWVDQFPAYVDDKGVQHPAGGSGKLNSAYTIGGPLLTVKTIEVMTGLKIDHFIVVNFASVVSAVDVVGGVDICTPVALQDPKSGLNLPAGESHLNGAEALELLRARYLDGSGDVGRMKRQQEFLTVLLKKAEGTSVTNIPNVVSSVTASMTIDDQLTHDDEIGLALKLRGMSTGNVEMITVPIANENYIPPEDPGAGVSVQWDNDQSKTLFGEIADDVDPATGQSETASASPSSSAATTSTASAAVRVPVAPSSINVQVFNASGITGQGAKAATDLSNLGFAMAGPAANAPTTGATSTVVKYNPGWNESATAVHLAIPGSVLQADPSLPGGTIDVYVGSSYTGTVASVQVVATSPSASSTSVPGSPSGSLDTITVTNGNQDSLQCKS